MTRHDITARLSALGYRQAEVGWGWETWECGDHVVTITKDRAGRWAWDREPEGKACRS